MATEKLSTQINITIFAVLDGSEVKLFLANNGAALDASDKVRDKFSGKTDAPSVTVTVVSTSGPVSVKNSSDSSCSWIWTAGELPAGGITLYHSSTTCDMPDKGKTAKDTFSIKVNGFKADPTVVISRGGAGNNVVVGSGPKHG
jgi:hypothetical protein